MAWQAMKSSCVLIVNIYFLYLCGVNTLGVAVVVVDDVCFDALDTAKNVMDCFSM